MTTDLWYPIGRFALDGEVSEERRAGWITELSEAPAQLRAAVHGLSDEQLETPYRPGGWSLRQVVHHLPESHLNAYTRFKLALTEDTPTIRQYEEARWAELPDTALTPIGVSLMLLESLHRRWVVLLKSMDEREWRREFYHPEQERTMRLDRVLALYAWHGKHHIAHIVSTRDRMGWR